MRPEGARHYRVLGLPKGHGLSRGMLLGLHERIPGTRDWRSVGYGPVVEGAEASALLFVAYLKGDLQPLRARPLSERPHVGKALGQIIAERPNGRVVLNIGGGDGVAKEDAYQVLGDVVGDLDLLGGSLGRQVSGQVVVQEVEPLLSVAQVNEGTARQGAYVVLAAR